MSVFTNIRFYVLVITFSPSVIILWQSTGIPDQVAQISQLTRVYALSAITCLYLALLATPLTRIFTFLPYRGLYIKARRAIGVSACYFALLHGSIAFFLQLGGFSSLSLLSDRYLLAISLSFTALVILILMASTSFDVMVQKLGFKSWKILHRLVYLAATLILIHVLLIGSDFSNHSGPIFRITL